MSQYLIFRIGVKITGVNGLLPACKHFLVLVLASLAGEVWIVCETCKCSVSDCLMFHGALMCKSSHIINAESSADYSSHFPQMMNVL